MATNRLFKSVAAVSIVCAWIASGQAPKFAVAQTTAGAQQKANPPKKPATVPSAIPELPAGIDLPPEVQAELKKALDKVKQVEAEAKGRKGTPKSPSPANATPSSPEADSPKKPNPGASPPTKSTVRITKPSAPASTAFSGNRPCLSQPHPFRSFAHIKSLFEDCLVTQHHAVLSRQQLGQPREVLDRQRTSRPASPPDVFRNTIAYLRDEPRDDMPAS